MNSPIRQITLIPFSTDSFLNTVSACLEQIDYLVDTVSPDIWLRRDGWEATQSYTVLFDQDINKDMRIEDLVKKVKKNRVFGVFSCESPSWQSEIITHLDDFLGWPSHINELAFRVNRFCDYEMGQQQACYSNLHEEFVDLNLIGKSDEFMRVLAYVKKTANCEASVLIEGETGTGKELAARAVHYLGKRRDYPFVPVNCGALPDSLLENELFGHMKGSFTDAKARQIGLVEQAHGGTLFLDEIDALTPKGQVALLRFLQDKNYRPLGGDKYKTSDVRIIAATNVNINELEKNDSFRSDLLYRLNVLTVSMPPLRARNGDVGYLAKHFLKSFGEENGDDSKYFAASALREMQCYDWPGNIRELENLVHRMYFLAEHDRIDSVFPDSKHQDRRHSLCDRRISAYHYQHFSEAKNNVISDFERTYLNRLFKETKGNVTQAAIIAGKERRAMGKLFKKYGLK